MTESILTSENIFPGLYIPKTYVVPNYYVRTERDLLMLAFAFMHCTTFDMEGAINFTKGSNPKGNILRHSMPDDFQSFYEEYQKSGANAFIARCFAESEKAPIWQMDFTLMSRDFDAVSKAICGLDKAVVFYPGVTEDRELHKKIVDETLHIYDLMKLGYPAPPVRERENEHPLKCYDVLKNDEKYKATERDFWPPNGVWSDCNQSSFRFVCRKEIPCCGQCEMLEKSYQMLMDEALDEETAAKLKKMVDEAGLFSKDEKGEPVGCHGCECGPCENELDCPETTYLAIETIRRLWSACYIPERFKN